MPVIERHQVRAPLPPARVALVDERCSRLERPERIEDTRQWLVIDPDGLHAEPEYDLGVIMREDPTADDLLTRAEWLAARTGCDPVAIWEWGVVERVSTGLLATRIDLQPVGAQMLAAADRIAELWNP